MRFHGDAASSAVEDAAAGYQSPSIIAAGADAQSVSLLATLVNLSLALICVKAPSFIERLGLAKKGAVTLAFLNMCAWVPLILAFLLSQYGVTPRWFALLWFINLMPAVLLSFQRDNWLSNLVPQSSLGRYFGQRLAIKSAFYLGAFFFLGYILDKSGGKSLGGFALVFTLAFVMAFVDFIIFTHMHEPKVEALTVPKQEPKPLKFGLFDCLGELKEKKLGTFVTFTSFFYLTVGLSGPLYAVYMLQELHFSYLSFTVVLSVEYFARIISVPLWGRLADKAGNIRVLGIVSRIIPLIPICWIFCSNMGYLAFVQTISGICWGAYDLCTQNYLYKVAPPEKKLRYIVYTRSLLLLCTALGGLLGAYFVKDIFLTFGSRVLSIFLVSGFFRALVVMYMMPRLIDLAVSFGKPATPPEVDIQRLDNAIKSRRGLFYRRPEQTAYTSKAQLQKNSPVVAAKSQYSRRRNLVLAEIPAQQLGKAASLVEPVTTRRRWYPSGALAANADKKSTSSVQEMKQPKEEAGAHQGLRRWYPSGTLAANADKKSTSSVQEMKQPKERARTHQGLYYNSVGWADYMKETLQVIVRDSQERKAAFTLRPAVAIVR